MVIGLPLLAALLALLVLSAAISATEGALLTINKVRLRHLAEEGHRSAQAVMHVLGQLDQAISTLLIANNLLNTAISAIGSWVFVTWLGPQEGLLVGTLVLTALLLVLADITPKLFATTHAELVMFVMVWPLQGFMRPLKPVATVCAATGRALLRLARVPVRRRAPLVTEEEIKVMIQMGREAGVLAEDELNMLHRIFEFSDSVVRSIMIPRERIAGVDLDAKPEEALDVLVEEGHSRIPVYRGDLDHIVGAIYARDILAMFRHGGLLVLSDLIRPITTVPAGKRNAELLAEFQRQHTQIAIVTEQDRTIGLVTLEDLLEEIVGEIHEEPPKG